MPSARVGVQRARLEVTKTNSELNRRLVEERIVSARVKRQMEEMHLAKMREVLMEKELVKKQAQFLLVALRQRLLRSASSHARRIVNLKTIDEARAALREITRQMLTEVKDLPELVVDPNWLEDLDEDAKS
jgi:hypothetical protein